MADHAHIVIGAGISGLSAAHYSLQAGIDTLVIEASERPGGCIHSVAFEDLNGYWVEAGGHTCFNSYGNLLAIMEALDLLEMTTAKAKQSYKLWSGGQQRNILSALHPLELLISLPGLFRIKKEGRRVADYYAEVLGEKNYRDLFGPAFRSVVCQQADDFPAEALFRKKPRRKDVLRAFTMPDGLSDIPRAIASQPGMAARYGARVNRLSTQPGRFEVELIDGTLLNADHLTLAVPPDAAARLLSEVAPTAADAIRGISVAEIDSQVLVFERHQLAAKEIAGLISIDGPFLSAVSRDFLSDDRFRGFSFHFEGGRYDQDERLQAGCEALGARVEDLVATAHIKNRLPALKAGHSAQLRDLDAALANTRIGVTGNWFLGVSIEDCVTRSRTEHERLFGPTPAATQQPAS